MIELGDILMLHPQVLTRGEDPEETEKREGNRRHKRKKTDDSGAMPGTVIYIHPDGIYLTAEFTLPGGKFKETFMLMEGKVSE